MVTALEVTGTKFMEEIDGVKQMPVDGISLAYSFNKTDAPSARAQEGDLTPAQVEKLNKPERNYSPAVGQNFPLRVYWGDTHLHTAYSTDAGFTGTTLGPEECGGEVKKVASGEWPPAA